MDAVVALGVMCALLWLLWQLTASQMPGVMRLVTRTLRRLIHLVVEVVWSMPVRQWGVAFTLWGWGVVIALIATLALGSQGGDGLLVVTVIWVAVGASWWGLRAWARWRFRPRPLPQRWRGR